MTTTRPGYEDDGEPEFGPCQCEGCRFEPTPTQLRNGLCRMCVEDGCAPVEAPATEATG